MEQRHPPPPLSNSRSNLSKSSPTLHSLKAVKPTTKRKVPILLPNESDSDVSHSNPPRRKKEVAPSPSPSDSEEGAEEGDDIYTIESILSSRLLSPSSSSKGWEYLVKWEGYDESHNTWEPTVNLDSCPDILADYLASHSRREGGEITPSSLPRVFPSSTPSSTTTSTSTPNPTKSTPPPKVSSKKLGRPTNLEKSRRLSLSLEPPISGSLEGTSNSGKKRGRPTNLERERRSKEVNGSAGERIRKHLPERLGRDRKRKRFEVDDEEEDEEEEEEEESGRSLSRKKDRAGKMRRDEFSDSTVPISTGTPPSHPKSKVKSKIIPRSTPTSSTAQWHSPIPSSVSKSKSKSKSNITPSTSTSTSSSNANPNATPSNNSSQTPPPNPSAAIKALGSFKKGHQGFYKKEGVTLARKIVLEVEGVRERVERGKKDERREVLMTLDGGGGGNDVTAGDVGVEEGKEEEGEARGGDESGVMDSGEELIAVDNATLHREGGIANDGSRSSFNEKDVTPSSSSRLVSTSRRIAIPTSLPFSPAITSFISPATDPYTTLSTKSPTPSLVVSSSPQLAPTFPIITSTATSISPQMTTVNQQEEEEVTSLVASTTAQQEFSTVSSVPTVTSVPVSSPTAFSRENLSPSSAPTFESALTGGVGSDSNGTAALVALPLPLSTSPSAAPHAEEGVIAPPFKSNSTPIASNTDKDTVIPIPRYHHKSPSLPPSSSFSYTPPVLPTTSFTPVIIPELAAIALPKVQARELLPPSSSYTPPVLSASSSASVVIPGLDEVALSKNQVDETSEIVGDTGIEPSGTVGTREGLPSGSMNESVAILSQARVEAPGATTNIHILGGAVDSALPIVGESFPPTSSTIPVRDIPLREAPQQSVTAAIKNIETSNPSLQEVAAVEKSVPLPTTPNPVKDISLLNNPQQAVTAAETVPPTSPVQDVSLREAPRQSLPAATSNNESTVPTSQEIQIKDEVKIEINGVEESRQMLIRGKPPTLSDRLRMSQWYRDHLNHFKDVEFDIGCARASGLSFDLHRSVRGKKITLIPALTGYGGSHAEAENQALGIALSLIGALTPITLDEVEHVFLHRGRKVGALAAQMHSLLAKGVDFFSFGNGEPVVPFFSYGFSIMPTFEALKRIVPFDDFVLHIKKFPTIKIHIHPATALLLKRFGEYKILNDVGKGKLSMLPPEAIDPESRFASLTLEEIISNSSADVPLPTPEEEFALIEAGSKGLRELRFQDIRRFYILVEKLNLEAHVRLLQEGIEMVGYVGATAMTAKHRI